MAKLVSLAALCLLLSVCAEVVTAQTCDDTDGAALQYFYRELVYARSEFKTWVPGSNCCTWDGVACDGNGNVVNLTIANPDAVLPYPNGLFYYIGTGLLGLKNLVYLTIKNVAFNGGIPPSWGTLSTLQVIDLDGCNLVGPLPAELCNLKGIRTFLLPDNLLSGSLPSCYTTPNSTFPNIQNWNISGNNFS